MAVGKAVSQHLMGGNALLNHPLLIIFKGLRVHVPAHFLIILADDGLRRGEAVIIQKLPVGAEKPPFAILPENSQI